MEKPTNERFITFSPKSARLPYPDDLELGQDITVTVGHHPFIYNVVKVKFFDNQDGKMNVNWLCTKRTTALQEMKMTLDTLNSEPRRGSARARCQTLSPRAGI